VSLGDGTDEGHLERAVLRWQARDGMGRQPRGGRRCGRQCRRQCSEGCLERAISREHLETRTRDGAGEMARGGEMVQEVAQEAAQARAASRWCGRDGMGKTAQGGRWPRGDKVGGGTARWHKRDGARWETVWARSRWCRVGDGERWRGQGRG